jgi:Trk K+ transport system NAD-binding subunit
MKIIICGAGRIADELLKRVSANWEITLLDKEEDKLAPFSSRFPNIVRLMAEDASSPVVLEKAQLASQDCVLAMTNDDATNLVITRFAREADVNNVLAVVRDPEILPDFHALDVWTISMVTDVARKIYQFLKDPRIRIIDLGEGEGELIELAVGHHDLSRLRDIITQPDPQWRVVGILRENKLLFPDRLGAIKEGDRLLILGEAELYNTFSNRLEENQPHFPRTYGQQMILGIEDEGSLDITELLNEAFYLAQGTHIEQIKTVYETTAADIGQVLSRWAESLQIETLEGGGDVKKKALSVAQENDVGIVVLPYVG